MSLLTRLIKKIAGIPATCTAVVVAAGSSQRMGGTDKLFVQICDTPVIVHTLMAFQKSDYIDEIVIVTKQESVDQVVALCQDYHIVKVSNVVVGGESRLDSVMNGVFACSWKTELIAIHDGARPCVDTRTIEKTILKATKRHAAAPGVPVSSTLKKLNRNVILETINREDVVEIQTPQTFNADLIKGALTKAKKDSPEITDDCMAVELLGVPVYVTKGSNYNIKITTNEDILVAEAIIKNKGIKA